MTALPDFEAWAVFAKVAEAGSLARAAAELNLAKATVSRALSRLETRLGVALFHRTSRRLSLTQSGQDLLPQAREILERGEAVEAQALDQAGAPHGVVRLAAPLSFGVQHLGPVLPGFLARYPEITLEIDLSDERVDLVAGGYDLALRIGALEDSSLLVRRLCRVRLLLVGAPGYFARRGVPAHPRELKDHVLLGYTNTPSPHAWRFRRVGEAGKGEGEEEVVPIRCQVWTNNADILNPALAAGVGLALQPEFLVWRELRAGTLETVMPDWAAPDIALHLVTPPSALRPARVRLLMDYLAGQFTKPPWAAGE
jgi:DNA-binding transcriptional LysR family regulator